MIELKSELIKFGETYLKFDFEYSESSQELIRKAYLRHIPPLSFRIRDNIQPLKISIEFDKGSLKTRIVVWGTVIYLGIANYGSFRAGVREIINDVRCFSDFVIERIDDGPNINPNNIIRTEKRTGLTGRIQELYYRIDRIERNLHNLPNNQVQSELQQIKQEISNLVAVLLYQDGQEFLNDLEDKYTQNLPDPDEKRTKYLYNRYVLKPEDQIEFIN